MAVASSTLALLDPRSRSTTSASPPGEVLMEDFIEGLGITQNKLAVSIAVPPRRINEIVHRKRGVAADAALRLAKYSGRSAESWINSRATTSSIVQRTAQESRSMRSSR